MKPIFYPQSQISSSSFSNPATSVSLKLFLSVFQPFGEILIKLLRNFENELQVAFRHYIVALKKKKKKKNFKATVGQVTYNSNLLIMNVSVSPESVISDFYPFILHLSEHETGMEIMKEKSF